MQNFTDFFHLSKIFNFNPHYSNQITIFELVFFVILLLIYFIQKIYFAKKNRQSPIYIKLSNKISAMLSTCVILGFMLLFFAWQSIPYLSAAFLVILLLLVLITWFISILKYYLNNFKIEEQQRKLKKDFEKYLPKAKTSNRGRKK